MRHALVMALQGFEGAMADRIARPSYAWANTADEYDRVDNGEVTQFGYDLASAYYQWLLNANKEAANKP